MNKPFNEILLRHPQGEDAEEITELIKLCDMDDHGVVDITLSDLLHMWNSIDISENAWVVQLESKEIIGYGFVDLRGEGRMDTCVFVHPEYKSHGIGFFLLSKVEERAEVLAREKSGIQHILVNHIPFANAAAKNLVAERGFEFKRLYQRMKIKLAEQPEQPVFPEGTAIHAFRPDKDEKALYTIYNDTFKDSWGYSRKDFTDWISGQKGDRYDADLWFIVWGNGKPLAFMMCTLQEDGLFVDYLGVEREWRKHGVGRALLLKAFNVAFERGESMVLLHVDTDSLTNAHRLYSSVGMAPDLQTALYQKTL